MQRRHLLPFCLVACLPWILAGCTRAHAKTLPESPALEMPAPPAHSVEPVEAEPIASTPVTSETQAPSRRATPPRPRTTPPPPAAKPAEPAKPEPAKPEPPPETPKPEVKSDEPRPPSPLQTAPATAEGEAERSVRATIAHATSDLSHVDYRALNADGRSQYDQAKRLMRQADDAMREKNLVFARSVADKAATIAAQLARR